MEHTFPGHAPKPKGYFLAVPYFRNQILEGTNEGHQEWRRVQVEKVLNSFDEAKKVMSPEGIQMLYTHLREDSWNKNATRPSDLPAFKHVMGTGHNGDKSSLYYPNLFIIQAVFVPQNGRIPSAIQQLYRQMSLHWDQEVTCGRKFYPHLEDTHKERELMLGNKSESRDTQGKSIQRSVVDLTSPSNESIEINDMIYVSQPKTANPLAPNLSRQRSGEVGQNSGIRVAASTGDAIQGILNSIESCIEQITVQIEKLKESQQRDLELEERVMEIRHHQLKARTADQEFHIYESQASVCRDEAEDYMSQAKRLESRARRCLYQKRIHSPRAEQLTSELLGYQGPSKKRPATDAGHQPNKRTRED
ncbi:hypothetical protein F53441_6299 [Fusarium austroafricanum]|uniref:Uncharacterized protein n=1 Tax=Fusarium austroafricanum TaxID=2364996 RepID=A0A8H4KJ16_9HYPO|nr:hypothetical protein F53441_6299 [Fusarium austroafricanum]